MHLERHGRTIATVDDWFQHARPLGGERQWRDGRSAKELAKAWCGEGGAPAPPRRSARLLSSKPALAHLEFRVGYPEHRVPFDALRTDLAVLCDGPVGRVAISIEAKADETFGRTVGEEIVNAAAQWAFEERIGNLDRLRDLVRAILPTRQTGEAVVGQLRYRLLTAIAGAWAFASQHDARVAVLVVHAVPHPGAGCQQAGRGSPGPRQTRHPADIRSARHARAWYLAGPMPVREAPSWHWRHGVVSRHVPDDSRQTS